MKTRILIAIIVVLLVALALAVVENRPPYAFARPTKTQKGEIVYQGCIVQFRWGKTVTCPPAGAGSTYPVIEFQVYQFNRDYRRWRSMFNNVQSQPQSQ